MYVRLNVYFIIIKQLGNMQLNTTKIKVYTLINFKRINCGWGYKT